MGRAPWLSRSRAAAAGNPRLATIGAVAGDSASASSRWRASPARLLRLLVGLALFGAGEACLVAAGLGNSPWTVLAEGLTEHTPLSIGIASVVIAVVVLLAWWPLRERVGLGTVANTVVIGLSLDATLLLLPDPRGLLARWALLLVGIGVVGFGSGLYLTAGLGPGPRDGLMTGLARVTGRSLGLVRGVIEVSVLVAGVVLGGTAGLGTLAFALLIGPAVAIGVRLCGGVDRVSGSARAPAYTAP